MSLINLKQLVPPHFWCEVPDHISLFFCTIFIFYHSFFLRNECQFHGPSHQSSDFIYIVLEVQWWPVFINFFFKKYKNRYSTCIITIRMNHTCRRYSIISEIKCNLILYVKFFYIICETLLHITPWNYLTALNFTISCFTPKLFEAVSHYREG